MFCGQIQAIYLGDYETGLELEKQTLRRWEGFTGRLFPLLRIAQIQTEQKRYTDALATLELAKPLGEKVVEDIGRAGLGLVTAMLFIALGDEQRLRSALDILSKIQQMAESNLVSQQYYMAAACKASAAHLKLAHHFTRQDENKRLAHFMQALESSQSALNRYQQFGFVQIVECLSEEILFRHSEALEANDRKIESHEFLKRAHAEMMRKYSLIPADSPYRKIYFENIQLHREIIAAHTAQRDD
jgi:hypothetical protein